MAGVQAQAEPRLAAAGVEQRRELVERAAERAAGAGRVLEVQRAAPRYSASASAIVAPARSIAGRGLAGLGRAGMQDHGGRADAVAGAQRVRSARSAILARISGSSLAQFNR